MPHALTLTTATPDATRRLGGVVGAWLEPGDVVALSGDLGAGKTCLVQGAAVGLGVRERVTSPTFVLCRQYAARVPVVHVDVYRLERVTDVDQLGDDVFAPDVVTFVEWAEAVAPVLPGDRLDVRLAVDPAEAATSASDADGPLPRSVALRARGGVADRLPALLEALAEAGLAPAAPAPPADGVA